ncbi:MAG TPA: hypothetical protein VKD91_10130 [Pyrinomonadaceae bacterium]|nr:hypothetical protein [Pyrinomonadaceae bacterium]
MDRVEHPIHAHEESDVSTAGIIKFGVALMVSTVVVCLLVWGLFAIFNSQAAKTETPAPPLYRGDRLPPEPRLQGMPGHQSFPSEDIKEFRAKENAGLNSYGWVNQQAGVIHIPIEEAKKLIVTRGLTALPANAAQGKKPEKKQ